MEYKVGTLVFNDWKIIREIGSGASGRVWEIEKVDHDIAISSALKVVQVPQNPSLEKTLYNDGMDEVSVTHFFQGVVNDLTEEIKIMIGMKGFPYIVNCEDYSVIKYPDQVKWDILIRMELLTPIQTYIQKNILSEADVLKLGRELLQTLQLFESKGIIHRDIKPDNIFVDNYGNFKIGDFGIARICDKASADLSKKGTENYMAPEVFHGKEYDHTVDIYSLGLVLYKLLNNNRLPFYPESGAYSDWDMQQALIDRLSGKKAMPLPASASPEFGKIITRMCAHSPEERYQRAEDVLADLEHITGSDKGIVGIAAGMPDRATDIGASDGSGAGAGFNATRAIFEGSMVIHDAGAVKKLNRTGITGNSSQKTGAPLSADAKPGADKAQKKEAGADSAQANTQTGAQKSENKKTAKSGSEKTAGEAKKTDSDDPGGGGGIKKKTIIQGITAAVIIFVILFYFLMNKTYSLTVTDGSGTGTYKGGQKVTAAAKDVPGSTFTKWEITGKLSLTDEERTEKTVSFKMPRHDVTLKAVYTLNMHSAVVNGGTGTGEYGVGEEVAVTADEPEVGKEFAGWDVEDGSVSLEHADKQKTSFVMPDEDVEVSATYKNIAYSLNVENGDGGGSYDYGETVRLVAQEKSGQTFKEWVVLDGDLALSDEEKAMPELMFPMPACSLIVQAAYETNQHKVTVNAGTGSGTYRVGDKVTITADEPGTGREFTGWDVKEGTVSLEHANNQKTSFVMPDGDIELAASYKNITYSLDVENGEGGGNYDYGETVRLIAQEKSGQTFKEWVILEGELALSDEEKAMPELMLQMPACDLMIQAAYETNQHEAVVNAGTGSGTYNVGDKVTITADAPGTGKKFAGWEIEEGSASLQNSAREKTYFNMPDEKVVISALYQDIDYRLTVNGGSGSGTYHYGDQVQVSAEDSGSDMPFSHWTVDTGTAAVSDLAVANITFEMPAEEVAMTAHYAQAKYTLKVKNGKGSGMYEAGSTVTISADSADASGVPFARWEVTSGSLKLEDASKKELSFEMPAGKVEIRAVYEAGDMYSVLVFGGSGAGIYAEGETVTVTADEEPGKKFNCWYITADGGETVENDNESFSFAMPAASLIITAMYDIE